VAPDAIFTSHACLHRERLSACTISAWLPFVSRDKDMTKETLKDKKEADGVKRFSSQSHRPIQSNLSQVVTILHALSFCLHICGSGNTISSGKRDTYK